MQRESEFKVYTARELLSERSIEDKYLVEGMLWEYDHVFLVGADKAGKSILSLQMACALSCGDAFLSMYEVPEPVAVLYIQMEGKKQDTIERLKGMINEQGVSCDPDNLHIMYCKDLPLDTQVGFDTLNLALRKLSNIRVVIIDPLYMAMVGDLNDNKDSRNMVKNIRALGDIHKVAFLINHHEHRAPKTKEGAIIAEKGSDSIFGSFVWRAFADHVLMLKVKPDERRTLTCSTQRSGKVVKDLELDLIGPYPLYFVIIGNDHKPYVEEVYKVLQTIDIHQGITREDLCKKCKLGMSAVEKSLHILYREDKADRLNPGHRPIKWVPCITTPIRTKLLRPN